jgi:hypothetical protein
MRKEVKTMAKAKRNRLEVLQDSSFGGEDNRVFCRFALNNMPVRFKDLKVGEKGSGVCKDISGGGMGADVSRELRPKTPLEMWVDLPDGFEPLHMLGKVVWSNLLGANWRVGIAFDRPKLMSLARILKFETPVSE